MMTLPHNSQTINLKTNFSVVQIGASTDGLDTFKKIIAAIPKDSGMAYIIVQNLATGNDLTDVLALSTHLPVHEIANEITLVPNHIYIIPNNNNQLSVELNNNNNMLELQRKNAEAFRNIELEALNEELQTSAEQLQSRNEELLLLNQELCEQQNRLIALQNYSESIINTIHEPLLIIDENFIVKSANPAFYELFKMTRKETEEKDFFGIGECQWNLPELKENLIAMLTANKPIQNLKVETSCPIIGKKVMLLNAHHVVDSKPLGMILLALEDITQVVSTNDLLRQKNEQLQKYNEQLENFSAAASHDLQDPLRKIHMFCNKIIENDNGLSDGTKHNLDRMKFSINNMSQLITDLIGFSRTNSIEKEFKKTNMNALLNKTIHDLKDDISEAQADITVTLLPLLNVIPYQIQQLFSNLIMNSIKYRKEGIVPTITIKSEKPTAEEILSVEGDSTKSYVKISISDNGIGFSQEYAHKIYQPFYRLHSKNSYRGTGLGLTLVKKIIVNHNGFIKANSKINEGTQFSLYFTS